MDDKIAQFTLPSCSDIASVIQCLRVFGIVRIPRFLSAERSAKILKEARSLLASDSPWVESLEYSVGEAVRIERTDLRRSYCKSLSRVLSDDLFERIGSGFFRGEPFKLSHDVYIVRDIVGVAHFAHTLHYDRNFHLKIFLYLTDTDIDNGPLYCIPGTQSYARIREQDNRQREVVPSEEATRLSPASGTVEEVAVTGPAGTLMIFDSDLLHRAGIIKAGERLALRSRCLPESSKGIPPV